MFRPRPKPLILIVVLVSLDSLEVLLLVLVLPLYLKFEMSRLAARSLDACSEDDSNSKTAASSAVRRIDRMYPEPHAWKKPIISPRSSSATASDVNEAVVSSMLE